MKCRIATGFTVHYEYRSLAACAAKLDLSENELIHLGAFGKIAVCANIYGMACSCRKVRIDLTDEDNKTWCELRSPQIMPAGIYELLDDTLRALELPDDQPVDLDFALKHDEYGWWEATFDPPIPITKANLVVMSGEIDFFLQEQSLDSEIPKRSLPQIGTPEWREENARKAANARHAKPGGSREKQNKIRQIWATGKYSSRDICAEQECTALGMSFSTARKALRNTPDP